MTVKRKNLPFSERSLCSAAETLAAEMHLPVGIGERGEKNLHALFKLAVEPDRRRHEIPIGGFVADVLNENGVCEIQTKNFARLCRKLEVFLPEHDMTVICPIIADKTILWVDGDGQVLRTRKSPKHGAPTDAAAELYALRGIFPHPRLRFLFPRLSVAEYRDATRQRSAAKRSADRLPLSLLDVIEVRDNSDVADLFPRDFPKTFTAGEFEKHIHRTSRVAHAALGAFLFCGLLTRKKEGRAYLYTQNH